MIVFNPMSNSWMNLPDNYPNVVQPNNPPAVPQTPTNPSVDTTTYSLPAQQVITCDGKASIDKLRMAPNSSVLILDNTAPRVWMCVSDGIGNVTPTSYKITPESEEDEKPAPDMTAIESRISQLENLILEMGEKLDGKSSSGPIKSEQSKSSSRAN